jgi:ferredoxin-NADP reductase
VCPDLLADVKKTMPNFQLIQVFSESAPSFVGNHTEKGFIDEKLIRKYCLDFAEREFYVSGPEPMVDAFKLILDFMGVRGEHVHQDWFPGYENEFVKPPKK